MVLFHADDYGYDPTVDERMLKLLRANKLAGISVLSTMVSKTSLKQLADTVERRRSPKIALHVNLTESSPKRSDLSRKGQTFTDTHGGLLPFVLSLLTRRISQKEVEKEIERQLKILTNAGIKVTAIDSHQHIHALSPVAEAVAAVARKHKIAYLRSYQDVRRCSLIAEMKYSLLKLAAVFSYHIYYCRIGLPITWKIKTASIAVMSWESSHCDTTNDPHDHVCPVTFIIHPYLPFDHNTSYMRAINL